MKNTTKILKLVVLAFAVAVLSALLVTAAYAETVASGNFAKANANATWTYTLDSDGTLTIGGTGSNGNTTFTYGADQDRNNCPWTREGKINGTEIKKIVILEETNIVTLGATALAYLPYCEEIVLPSTVTTLGGYEDFTSIPKLRTISVHGRDDAGEGIYDLRNITSIPYKAFRFTASGTAVPEGIEVWLGDTALPWYPDPWRMFYGFSTDTDGTNTTAQTEMTTKVTFKVAKGSNADTYLKLKIAQQANVTTDLSAIDRTTPLNIEIKYYNPKGTFANSYAPNATWTWELDIETGTLTVGGTSADGSTVFAYGANSARGACPWQRTGIIDGIAIKKIVILPETGITALGASAIAYAPYLEELVIPSTLTTIGNYESICGNVSLKTISVIGSDDAGEGIYDFRNITNIVNGERGLSGNADARYVPEGIEVWLGQNTAVPDASSNWHWFGSVTSNWWLNITTGADETSQAPAKVVIKVVSGSDAATKVAAKVAQQASANKDSTTAANISYECFAPAPNGVFKTAYSHYSWELQDGTLTFTVLPLDTSWNEFYFDYTGFVDWIDYYREEIRHIVVPAFSQYSNSRSLYPFANLPNLETVKWDTTTIANGGSTKDGVGMFYNCPKLTTFGTSKSFKEGVINLSGITFSAIDESVYLKNMFYGCEHIEKVVWDNIKFTKTENNAQVEIDFVIGASMFENCTSLRSVDISGAKAILSAAFKNCSSLGGTVLYFGDTNIGDAFYGCGGLFISTDSAEKVAEMFASMNNAGVSIKDAMVSCMVHGGFAVRTKDYNGLRSFYSFVGETNVNFDNLTLVEYGSIVGAVENYELYTKDIGGENSIFTLDGTEFKTPEKIVKTAVYIADGYTGDIAKYKTVNENGTVDFVVTVTKFAPSQYNRDVIMNGYEIWLDNEGDYIVVFTEYPNDDYKVNSLYKTTMGMLVDDVIEIGNENSPVYAVVNSDKAEFDCGNAAVSAFFVDHHLLEGKKIAVYVSNSDETIELNDLGIPASELPKVADYIFSGNVTCSLPQIDDYWMEHINAQLATLPEGKSFIAITDTHYESWNGNVGKSADLMQYVRKTTGISKVINLGDPFHQEDTYEGALAQLSRSMEEKFFNYFGGDGLYAIGNHDSNITIARNSDGLQMDLVLQDVDIYERTVKHIVEENADNDNLVLDEELFEIIAGLKDQIEGFELDNVSADNKVKGVYFGNVSYTAEQMYENLLAWAKLHYAYYDHESKVCYIMLNTGALTVTDLTTLGLEMWAFNNCQYNFINKILNQISEDYSDYDIVVAGHMFYDHEVVGQSGNSNLLKMLSAFEAGGSVAFWGTGNNAISGALMGSEGNSKYLEYDFSDRSFTGEIVCVTGHRHIDLQMISQTIDGEYQLNADHNTTGAVSEDSIPLFVLNQDNAREGQQATDTAEIPVVGTITEQCFSIFTITEDNKIVVTRIGANSGWLQKSFDMK